MQCGLALTGFQGPLRTNQAYSSALLMSVLGLGFYVETH